MPEKVIMPKSGMSMEFGTITRWLKNEGDTVERDEPILEIETDKLTMEVEAESAGVLLKKLYQEGDVVPVVTTIAWIGQPGEAIPEDKIPATPVAKRLAKEHGINLDSITPSGKSGEITKADILNATPLAKKIAQSSGITISELSGTGPAGKIYSRDVTRSEKLTGMRKTIAERMLASHISVPSATLRIEVDADPIFHLRVEYNRVHETRITFNDLILRATILTLNEFPELNAHLKCNTPNENEIVVSYNESINLGVAISVNRGLLVPVIKDAKSLSVCKISEIVKDLSERAKNNRLKPDELSGGTFTVTNLGMLDIVSFTPIINLPEVAILGVCAIVETPVVKNGTVAPGRRMGLCLTHDHRLIDGALAASFLQRIKGLIESPISLL